nr:hypothetical protein CFP56_53252 [Quercus suber]
MRGISRSAFTQHGLIVCMLDDCSSKGADVQHQGEKCTNSFDRWVFNVEIIVLVPESLILPFQFRSREESVAVPGTESFAASLPHRLSALDFLINQVQKRGKTWVFQGHISTRAFRALITEVAHEMLAEDLTDDDHGTDTVLLELTERQESLLTASGHFININEGSDYGSVASWSEVSM